MSNAELRDDDLIECEVPDGDVPAELAERSAAFDALFDAANAAGDEDLAGALSVLHLLWAAGLADRARLLLEKAVQPRRDPAPGGADAPALVGPSADADPVRLPELRGADGGRGDLSGVRS